MIQINDHMFTETVAMLVNVAKQIFNIHLSYFVHVGASVSLGYKMSQKHHYAL